MERGDVLVVMALDVNLIYHGDMTLVLNWINYRPILIVSE